MERSPPPTDSPAGTTPTPAAGGKLLSRGLLLASLAIGLLAPLSIALHMYTSRGFTHTVGVFVVLAELLREGILYPATPTLDLVYSAFYHPLAFAPLALLPGHGVDMLPALRVLVGTELCACLGLTALLARLAGLRGTLSWQPSLWALCTVPVTFCLLGMRDDPRAMLFALLAVVLHQHSPRLRPELAGLALVLAFMTKATAPAAPGLALSFVSWRRGGLRELTRLWATCGLGTAAAVGWLQWGLGTDFLGNGLYYALFNPAKAPRTWPQTFAVLWRDLTWARALPILLTASLLSCLWRLLRRRAELWELLVLACWLKTFAAYRSVGTELNHLLDLTLFSCLQLGIRARSWLRPAVALPFLVALLFVGWPFPINTLFPYDSNSPPLEQSHVRQKAKVLRALLKRKPMPILVEEPLIAWEAGSKPLITDPLLTFGTLRRFPEIRQKWFGPADQPGALQMIVLMRNPMVSDPPPEEWYGPIHFDREFLAEVRAHWKVVATDPQATVLVRK